jgi:3-oxoacyl-[acyl-carrier-protein] synthase II
VKRRVVITGLGIVSPIGIGKDAYWDALVSGRSGCRRLRAFDPSGHASQVAAEVTNFDPEDFLDPRTAGRTERYTHFAMAAARLAVDDACLDLSVEDRARCGVIVGSSFGGIAVVEREQAILEDQGPRRVSPMLIPMLLSNLAPGEIAIGLGLQGINYTVSAACSSANHAIGLALRHLQYGDADVILAGGTEAAITPLVVASFCQLRTLATRYNHEPARASRPFDADRCGFVIGEGAALLLLETLDHALARGAAIYAELRGFGANDDAHHITAPHPEGRGLARAIELAIADAGIRREEVDYVNAHGTSTGLNDRAETQAIKTAFGEHARNLAVSATKSMTGHLLGAAGGAELIATVLCMEHGSVHPTINIEVHDPECDLDYVPNVARAREVRCAVSNSCGFGGHNSVLVVKRVEHARE